MSSGQTIEVNKRVWLGHHWEEPLQCFSNFDTQTKHKDSDWIGLGWDEAQGSASLTSSLGML